MQKQNVRVVLAAEYSQARSFLSQIIEQESGVEIVGQAQDAMKALTLTRNLRPDVAILDIYLPHSISFDTIPLSRASGLDTAQAIYDEVPRTKVILLNNLDKSILSGGSLRPGLAADYCVGTKGKCISIAQWAQATAVADANEPLFADVTRQEADSFQGQPASLCDKVIFFGAFGFAAGWLLTLTMFLAVIGAPLAALGALTAIVGLVGKLINSSWRKVRSQPRRAPGARRRW